MSTKPDPAPEASTFASRKAEREAREAIEGTPTRRQITNRVGHAVDSAPVTVVRHVQA